MYGSLPPARLGSVSAAADERDGAFRLPHPLAPRAHMPRADSRGLGAPAPSCAAKPHQVFYEKKGALVYASRDGGGRGHPACAWAEAGTFLPASRLAGGGVQSRNSPPEAGLAPRSPTADVGRLGRGQ